MDENKRIKGVYSNRDKSGKRALYSWSNLHALYQSSTKSRMMSKILHSSFGDDLSSLIVLDVGCGFGNFLRELVEWGVDSDNCIGTEFLDDRLEKARKTSPKGIYYHLGDLDFDVNRAGKQPNLVSAHTVFSSILDDRERKNLADQMWDKVRKGGGGL